MKKYFVINFFLPLLLACNQNSVTQQISIKDSVLSKYLELARAIPGYDTFTYDYKVLKAYHNNDISTLNHYLTRIIYSQNKLYTENSIYNHTCIDLPELNKSQHEELYRFHYSEAFCPNSIIITISKMDNSFEVEFILYQIGIKPPIDSIDCKILKRNTKKITQQQWDEFSKLILYADFWGLKKDNDAIGFDGNSLRIEGYINEKTKAPRSPKYHIVNRWLSNRYAIHDAFLLSLKYITNNSGCITEID